MRRSLQSISKRHGQRFLRFAVCGGLGAVIDFSVLFACVEGIGIHPRIAYVISTGLAMLFVFLSNRMFAFRARGAGAGGQAAKFFVVYSVSAVLNYVFSLGFFSLGIHFIIAKGLAIGVIMLFNYACLHTFVFRSMRAQL